MKKILKFAFNEFIYGGHLQCLGTAGIVYVSAYFLNLKIGYELLLLAYLIFYPIYINDRFRGVAKDELTNAERSKHFKKYLPLMPKILALSILFLAISLFYFANITFAIFALLLVLFGILYPLYFKNLTRKIVGFKNFYVSSFFTVIALSPVIFYSSSPFLSATLIALMALVFAKTFFMQIILDCKDVEGDREAKLLTIPIMLGKEKSFFILQLLSLLSASLILAPAIFFFKIFPLPAAMLFLTIPFNFYCVSLAKRQQYSSYILASGEFVLWVVLILTGLLLFS